MSQKDFPVKIENEQFNKMLITLLVVIVTILVVFIYYRRKKTERRSILLTGLCDSGKTLIFSQLTQSKHIQTLTSIKENIDVFPVNNNYLRIIDIPGHERLRNKFFDQYKTSARGIVFVVDSLTIQQDIRDAAEFLYNILTDPVILSNLPSVLILCNKQDQTLAKGNNAVKSMLEKELNTLRITKSSQLESVDPKTKKTAGLGDYNKDFDFSGLRFKVDFAESFAFHKSDNVNIASLRKWIENVA